MNLWLVKHQSVAEEEKGRYQSHSGKIDTVRATKKPEKKRKAVQEDKANAIFCSVLPLSFRFNLILMHCGAAVGVSNDVIALCGITKKQITKMLYLVFV